MGSKSQTVVEALKTALETTRTGIVYEPDLVQPILYWPEETAIPIGLETVYLISVGDESGRQKQSCDVTERLEVAILGLRRYASASDDPFKESPARIFVATDLGKDIQIKLEADPKLGATALDSLDGVQTVKHDYYLPSWVIAEVQTSVLFRREKGAR